MTKEVTRVQQITADDEKRDAILKTRHQLAKKIPEISTSKIPSSQDIAKAQLCHLRQQQKCWVEPLASSFNNDTYYNSSPLSDVEELVDNQIARFWADDENSPDSDDLDYVVPAKIPDYSRLSEIELEPSEASDLEDDAGNSNGNGNKPMTMIKLGSPYDL